MTKFRYNELYKIIKNKLFYETITMHRFIFRRLTD